MCARRWMSHCSRYANNVIRGENTYYNRSQSIVCCQRQHFVKVRVHDFLWIQTSWRWQRGYFLVNAIHLSLLFPLNWFFVSRLGDSLDSVVLRLFLLAITSSLATLLIAVLDCLVNEIDQILIWGLVIFIDTVPLVIVVVVLIARGRLSLFAIHYSLNLGLEQRIGLDWVLKHAIPLIFPNILTFFEFDPIVGFLSVGRIDGGINIRKRNKTRKSNKT